MTTPSFGWRINTRHLRTRSSIVESEAVFSSVQGDCQQVWVPAGGNNQYGYYETVCQTLPCTGSVSITVGSSPPVTASINWETGDANTPIADLAAALNVSGSPVTAVANANGTLTLTSTTTGVTSNIQ